MREYKDIISMNANRGNPTDRSVKQVKAPASNIGIGESRNIDPAENRCALVENTPRRSKTSTRQPPSYR